jgi:heptosyltransferase-1
VPAFRRILIVKLSALGDVAHALPAADYLRRAVPGAEIDWVVDRRFADVVVGHPGLRRVVSLDLRRWKGDWRSASTRREALAAVRDLRAARYDAAFDLQGNVKSGVVALLSGAPLRFGFDRSGVREGPNVLFTNRRARSRPEDVHVTEKILRVASLPFGGVFPVPWPSPVIVTAPEVEDRAARVADDLLPGASPRLLVHAGTTWNTKKMDPPFWAETARVVRTRYPQLGVFLSWGTEREQAEAQEIAERLGGAVAVLPRMTLKELAAFARRCGHVLGPDTGPLHLAAAAGAKTVSVFRGSDGRYAAPRGEGHRFLQAPLPCSACQIKGDKMCDRDALCRASIPPAAAADAVAGLMAGGAARC